MEGKVELTDDTITDLKNCVSMIYRRMKSEKQKTGQHIINDLISSYIGMIAEVYQKGFEVALDNRHTTITFQFKSLLSTSYRSMKRASEYASRLNLSPVYLNEAVKKATGLTVGEHIRNEIVIHAKRLLFYTDLTIKEIALELGYEDWAYFTRLFTKASGLPPSQFRKQYLK